VFSGENGHEKNREKRHKNVKYCSFWRTIKHCVAPCRTIILEKCKIVLTLIFLCAKLMSKGEITMITYTEKIEELRASIDYEINEMSDLNLSTPELIERARMIEEEMCSSK